MEGGAGGAGADCSGVAAGESDVEAVAAPA